jgi:hypothetical protein
MMTRGRQLRTALTIALASAGGLLGAATWRAPDPQSPSGEPVRSLCAGAVRYVLPAAWRIQGFATGGGEGIAASIPCPALAPTPHSADVNLLALDNPGGEDLRAWSERRLDLGGVRRIVEDRTDGAWRTVVSAGEDRGASYVVVERFGATPRARVHAVIAFPALDAIEPGWFERAGEDIDRFLHALAVEGAAPAVTHLAWERGRIRVVR